VLNCSYPWKWANYTFEVSTNLVHWMAAGGIENVPTNTLSVVDKTLRIDRRFYRMRVGRFIDSASASCILPRVVSLRRRLNAQRIAPVAFQGYSATDADGDAPFPSPSSSLLRPGWLRVTAAPAVIDYAFVEDSYAYQSPMVTTSPGAPELA
jgi:hypothetical protein